jgi:hypothetical protein
MDTLNPGIDPNTGIDPVAAPVTFTDDQIRNAANSYTFARNGAINAGIDGNPDQAAHAIRISQATDIPAPLINSTYDEFIKDHQKLAAQRIVAENPDLDAYVMHHPLAAEVSADDWAQLNDFTRQARLSSSALEAYGGNKGFAGGAESDVQQGDAVARPDWAELAQKYSQGQFAGPVDPLVMAAHDPGLNIAERIFAAIAFEAKGFLTGPGDLMQGLIQQQRGEQPYTTEQIGQVGITAATTGGIKPLAEGVPDAAKPAPKPPSTAVAAILPWVQAGVEPPTGLHPEIDAAKAQINATRLEIMEAALEKAQATATGERSPEMLQASMRDAFADQSIGISADAVAKLYGDKPPTPDDGILGWVPDIAAQLEAARTTNSDVMIPMRDWLAHGVEDGGELHKALHDDLRMWPGGVTAREAGELGEPKAVVAEALPGLRASASLEPKFGPGDRAITLEPKLSVGEPPGMMPPPPVPPGALPFEDVREPLNAPKKAGAERITPKLFGKYESTTPGLEEHEYNLLDENGKSVGTMRLIPKPDTRTIMVDWIGGNAGLWANSFGPSLVRDLKKQLKALYPDYDYLTGWRVSGARHGPAAGIPGENIEQFWPRVKLDLSGGGGDQVAEIANLQRMLGNAFYYRHLKETWTDEGGGAQSLNLPPEGDRARPIADQLGKIISDEINRITGGQADVKSSMGTKVQGTQGKATGLYVPSTTAPPKIIFDLLGRDPMGVGRHEAVHFLRGYGFITEGEWGLLKDAAASEGWLDRYKIHEKYDGLSDEDKFEEAIAEGFREWAAQAPEVRPKTGVGAVFQKIMDLFEGIKAKLGFGKDATWEEVFAKIKSGEVGERGPASPREGAFDLRASQGDGSGYKLVHDETLGSEHYFNVKI